MSSKFLAALASIVLFLPALYLPAQQPAPRPIQAMPYSPSLDVTSLDRSVDPCVDFYKFSCGGWEKKNPIPADQSGCVKGHKVKDGICTGAHLAKPKIGQHITVTGPNVWDSFHKWNEIHPVWAIH